MRKTFIVGFVIVVLIVGFILVLAFGRNKPPELNIITPSEEGVKADQSYTIGWVAEDKDSNATISLYYDVDQDGMDGTLIVSGIKEDDKENVYLWDTTGVSSGTYYIYGKIDDGKNPPVFDYSRFPLTIVHNIPPTFAFVRPNKEEEEADKVFKIEWKDYDPDDNAKISLFYDVDNKGFDGVEIARAINEDDKDNTYLWDTRRVEEGDYWLYGVINDEKNPPFSIYSKAKVKIYHGKKYKLTRKGYRRGRVARYDNRGIFHLFIMTPPREGAYADQSFDIDFAAEDSSGTSCVSLYYDQDNKGCDGELIVTGLTDDSGSYTFRWDTSNVPEGTYYIYGKIDNGRQRHYAYSFGSVTIKH